MRLTPDLSPGFSSDTYPDGFLLVLVLLDDIDGFLHVSHDHIAMIIVSLVSPGQRIPARHPRFSPSTHVQTALQLPIPTKLHKHNLIERQAHQI